MLLSPLISVSISLVACMGNVPSVLHCQDNGIKCDDIFTWHIAYLVEGIQEHVLQIFDAVDGCMVL